MTHAQRLVLWDVDHTLIDTGGVGRDLYQAAFEQATGEPFRTSAKISGSTELRIFAETLDLHGLSSTPELALRYAHALTAGYRAAGAALRARGRALDGTAEILRRLAARGDVQTIVTGNLRDVTVVKLEVFGLGAFLDLSVGAYAEDDQDRGRLAKIALDRVAARYGGAIAGRAVLVGDTPADIAAARDAGVAAIGVATGMSAPSDLRYAAIVLDDLSDTNAAVAAIDTLTSVLDTDPLA